MRKFAKHIAKLVTGTEPVRKRLTHRDLIRMESKIGATLFGPIAKGHRREFFCLDEHTWIWYEEWLDENGKRQSVTTRYEIHPTGILKVQDGHPYQVVSGTELHNFALATRMYREQVMPRVYGRDAITGQPLAVAK
jgi:hypothetical protein